MTDWQDISTAPKGVGPDGKPISILVYHAWEGVIHQVRWIPNYLILGSAWVDEGSGEPLSCLSDVTHWMPLPAPPTPKGGA